jgi:trimethylamine--corrinoid protein Co-methyltransferase
MDHTSDIVGPRRTGGRRKSGNPRAAQGVPRAVPIAGRLNPLDDDGLARIHAASLDILDRVGMSEAPQIVIDAVISRGGRADLGRAVAVSTCACYPSA